jgi:hypothetical protein
MITNRFTQASRALMESRPLARNSARVEWRNRCPGAYFIFAENVAVDRPKPDPKSDVKIRRLHRFLKTIRRLRFELYRAGTQGNR